MIVVCGEALVDLVQMPGDLGYTAKPGGSPANVATALGRLEIDVALLARLSVDHFGQLIRGHLTRSRVDLNLAINTGERSTVAMVSLDPAGDASYLFAIEGGADDGWRAADIPALPSRAQALHVSGSLALGLPEMGDAIESLLRQQRHRRVISFDPNLRPALAADVPTLKERLERWIRYADIVKTSAQDLAWAYPGEDPLDIARRWRTAGPALVVITKGADGSVALGPSGALAVPAHPVTVVDSVGAGDAFTAGLLAGLTRAGRLTPATIHALGGDELDHSLRLASRVAALTCGRAGADPPWLDELGLEPAPR